MGEDYPKEAAFDSRDNPLFMSDGNLTGTGREPGPMDQRSLTSLALLVILFGAVFALLLQDVHEAGAGRLQRTDGGNNLYLPLIAKPLTIPPGMVHIPAGEFQMGCDPNNPLEFCSSNQLPLHTVYLDAYNIDMLEVTNTQYAAFLNARNSNDCGAAACIGLADSRITFQNGQYVSEAGYQRHPVRFVSWHGADSYCRANNKRLPTEAEWEKAARGSNDTRVYPWGNQRASCDLANYFVKGFPAGCVGNTTPVGSYPDGASPYGVLDMSGNAYEWVNDWYDADYYNYSPYSNPTGPGDGTRRVLRGGGFTYPQDWIRLAHRYLGNPTSTFTGRGFRCAAD